MELFDIGHSVNEGGYNGYEYQSLACLDQDFLIKNRRPLKWQQTNCKLSDICTASIRANLPPPAAVNRLRGIMHHCATAAPQAICLLVHEATGPALYIHSNTCLQDVVPGQQNDLSFIRKKALVFAIQAGVDQAVLQRSLELFALQHAADVSAAYVDAKTNTLILFMDNKGVELVADCYQISLNILGNVCLLTDETLPDAKDVYVSVNSERGNTEVLLACEKIIVQSPSRFSAKVDNTTGQLVLQTRKLNYTRKLGDIATETLRELGVRCAVKRNHVILYHVVIPDTGFQAELSLVAYAQQGWLHPAVQQAAVDLVASVFPTLEPTLSGDSIVQRLCSRLQIKASLRYAYLINISLGGVVCCGCVQNIVDELTKPGNAVAGISFVAVNVTRSILSVKIPSQNSDASVREIERRLQRLGFSGPLLSQGPDLEEVDDPVAKKLFSCMQDKDVDLKSSKLQKDTCSSKTPRQVAEIDLARAALHCHSCSYLLFQTLSIGQTKCFKLNVENSNGATLIVEYALGCLDPTRLLATIHTLGYSRATLLLKRPGTVPLNVQTSSPSPSLYNSMSPSPSLNGLTESQTSTPLVLGVLHSGPPSASSSSTSKGDPRELPLSPSCHFNGVQSGNMALPQPTTAPRVDSSTSLTHDPYSLGHGDAFSVPELEYPSSLPSFEYNNMSLSSSHDSLALGRVASSPSYSASALHSYPISNSYPGLLSAAAMPKSLPNSLPNSSLNSLLNSSLNSLPDSLPSPMGRQVEGPAQPISYNVWYENVQTRVHMQQGGEKGYSVNYVGQFTTMEEFWSLWKEGDIENLEEGGILMVFQGDIPPDHNHPANRAGGRWFVRGVPSAHRAKLWTNVVLAMINNQLNDSTHNQVCGVVLSVKPSGDRIEVWVDGWHPLKNKTQKPEGSDAFMGPVIPDSRDGRDYMPNILTGILGKELGHRRFHFWTHAGFERHRKSHRGSVRRAKRHSRIWEQKQTESGAGGFDGAPYNGNASFGSGNFASIGS